MYEPDLNSNPSKIKNEGSIFTILHPGSEFGSLDGCNFLLNPKNNDKRSSQNNVRDPFPKFLWTL